MTGYRIERRRSTASDFHARPIPEPARSEIWVHEVSSPALVLGSTQRDDVVDSDACRRSGVEVVRRRSGGGAVFLKPDEVVWVDVIVPAGSPGWFDDVHASMIWFGERLAAAFAAVGIDGLIVHRGAMVSTDWSRLVCFDGLGPGEVSREGAKLVGISQRRTRRAARLQACWYTAYHPTELVGLLATEIDESSLRPVATAPAAAAAVVPDRLVDELSAT